MGNDYLKNYSISYAIEWGSLPLIIDNPEVKVDTLATYVNTYLKEELVSEAIIRKLDPFVRFLQIAGIYNGQILNIEKPAIETIQDLPNLKQLLQSAVQAANLDEFRQTLNAMTHGK